MPLALAMVVVLLLGISDAVHAEPAMGADLGRAPYKADTVPQIGSGRPTEVDLLPPVDTAPWPAAVVEDLRQRVLREWPSDQRYGSIDTQVKVWLEYPLVTAQANGRVSVPVLEDLQLPIRGRLVVPPARLGRRIVVLLDVSESANARSYLISRRGSPERLSVLEAGLRVTDLLAGWLDAERREFGHLTGYRPSEIGVIVFGEGTWSVFEPGTSLQEVRRGLEIAGDEAPAGEGRSDAACALRLAGEWLRDTPEGTLREIVILTNGDLPHSGRFTDCDAYHYRGEAARAACLATINRGPCPASHRFDESEGRSDVAQLFSFAREVRSEEIRVSVFLFQRARPPRFFRELARHTRGELLRISSAMGIERGLRSVLRDAGQGMQIDRVFARNLHTGYVSGNLLGANFRDFEGELPLLPGPNDVELRVESDQGAAGLLRFRIYSTPDPLGDYLGRLRDDNRRLERREDELMGETQRLIRRRSSRSIEVTMEPPPQQKATP